MIRTNKNKNKRQGTLKVSGNKVKVNNLREETIQLRKDLAKKRAGDKVSETHYLYVTHCGPEAVGSAMKFPRLTHVETIPTSDITLQGIKKACAEKFNQHASKEVILMKDVGGKSIMCSSQLQLSKPFCVRFVDPSTKSAPNRAPATTRTTPHHYAQSAAADLSNYADPPPTKRRSTSESLRVSSSNKKSSVPVSIGQDSLLAIGGVIQPSRDVVTLTIEEFSVATKSWGVLGSSVFIIDQSKCGEGGFRTAYRARQLGNVVDGKFFVVKKYKGNRGMELIAPNQVMQQTRKHVQMHMFARNFLKLMNRDLPESYGKRLVYDKAYLARSTSDEVLFVEPYLTGKFDKYINNNGCIYAPDDDNEEQDEITSKSEAFSHYTFEKTNQKAMVLDIQGVNWMLTDPEVATMDKKEKLFCSGNLNTKAIAEFICRHVCNKYCEMLKLECDLMAWLTKTTDKENQRSDHPQASASRQHSSQRHSRRQRRSMEGQPEQQRHQQQPEQSEAFET